MKTLSPITFVLATLICASAIGQQQNPCTTEQAHQFDFWVGEWDVYNNGTDTIVGHNLIKPVASGCALLESWNSVDNRSIGSSINKYDFTTKKWEQMWVDNAGSTLKITGEYKNGKMILENEEPSANGGKVKNRITWFNNPDGTVRQYWQYNTDGKTWQVAFDGIYKKVRG